MRQERNRKRPGETEKGIERDSEGEKDREGQRERC